MKSMNNTTATYPPHLTTVNVKVESADEVYFSKAYYDNFSCTWRDPETDNIIQGVKGWKL